MFSPWEVESLALRRPGEHQLGARTLELAPARPLHLLYAVLHARLARLSRVPNIRQGQVFGG